MIKWVYFKFFAFYLLNKDGIAKCDIRTNIEKLWSFMTGYDLSKKLWSLDLFITIYLKNLSLTKIIKEDINLI